MIVVGVLLAADVDRPHRRDHGRDHDNVTGAALRTRIKMFARGQSLPFSGGSRRTLQCSDETLEHKTCASLRREDGQAIVEFALVVPVLALLLFGITQFGLAFRDYLAITDAARVGARAAAVEPTSNPCAAATAAIEHRLNEPVDPIQSRITCTAGTNTGDLSDHDQPPVLASASPA